MASVGTDGTAGGNTNSPAVKEPKKHRNYFFTWNNPDISGSKLAQEFNSIDAKYVFQLEEGENKTRHFQGLIGFKNARSFSAVKSDWPKWHFEPVRKIKAVKDYCSKVKTRLEGPWVKGFTIKKDLKTITNLYKWQQQIISILEQDADDRKIYWLVDRDGNLGKTALCKYICHHYKALYVSGKATDIKYGIVKYLEDEDNLDIVLLDFPRSLEQYVSFDAIESVKNGIFFSSKYESGMCMFNSPHVFCFSNFKPETSALSQDRWIKCYVEDGELKMDGW